MSFIIPTKGPRQKDHFDWPFQALHRLRPESTQNNKLVEESEQVSTRLNEFSSWNVKMFWNTFERDLQSLIHQKL